MTIHYFRDGRAQQIAVKLAALDSATPDIDEQSRPSSRSVSVLNPGMKLQNATPDIMKQRGNAPGDSGVVIVQTTPGGAADTAGLQSSDVIIAVNGKPVPDNESFSNAITPARSNGVRLQILRQGRRTFAFLKMPSDNDSAVRSQ